MNASLWLNFRGLEEVITELSFTDKEKHLLSLESIISVTQSTDTLLENIIQPQDYNSDLDNIKFDYQTALNLLEDKPSFDEEFDFKKFLFDIYDLAALKSDSLYEKWLDKSRNRKAENEIAINLNLAPENYTGLFALSIPLKKLLRYSLNLDLNTAYSPSLSFTLLTLQTAVLICKNGLYFPEFIRYGNQVELRYKAILNNDVLKKRLKALYRLCPSDFVLKSKAALNEFLSYLVTYLVKDMVKSLKGFPKNDFRKIFISSETFQLETLTEENIINATSLWLSKLELQNYDLRPLLSLEEKDKDSFALNLKLLDLQSESEKLSETSLSRESLSDNYSDERVEGLYKQLYLLQDYIPALTQIISTEAKAKPNLSANALGDLLIKADKLLPVLGLKLDLPKALENLIKPKLLLKLNHEKESGFKFEFCIEMGEKL